MVGRKLELSKRAGRDLDAAGTGTALLLRGLSVDMPGERLKDFSIEVRKGEILGLAGLAGGGKVAVANGVFGLHPARVTEARLEDAPLPLGDAGACLASGLALVSEDRRGTGLMLDEGIARNVSAFSMLARNRFLRATWLGPLALVDHAAERKHAREWIDALGVKCIGPDQPVRRLSGGNQQKVCLARALALEPKLLFVSEPTRGIDVGAKSVVLDRIVKANREHGTTVVMASSELAELRMICDRIAVIAEGKLAGVLKPDAPDVEFGLLMAGVKNAT
jgi:simple sugar transport system ATP-binding protein